jgi:L-fuconate dehydratase
MTPEEVIRCIPFRYISDALTPHEALGILRGNALGRAERERLVLSRGIPAYTTSIGWLGYTDEKIRQMCRTAVAGGWQHFKLKVGRDLDEDVRRASIVREEIGPDRALMLDANQVWDVDQAIAWMHQLAPFHPRWIEEPTSPDDILGHARIADAMEPLGIGVATGEHCHNRVMFKQFFQSDAISFAQVDPCRLGGVNEVLAAFSAAKFDVAVCPHAGGVICNTCNIWRSSTIWRCGGLTVAFEYVDHLHEGPSTRRW